MVNRIIKTIHKSDDIIEIFENAINQLSLLSKCDYVNILFNNQKSRYFFINQALNQKDPEQSHDVIIPYNQTALTEILRTHQSIVRNDLSERGKMTPGDLKYLPEGAKSDLSVPIISKNRVLAVINLSSYQSNYFTRVHITQTEQIAMLLSLALERIELTDKLNKKNSDVVNWQNKFNTLIKSMTEAVAIVRQDYDLIYESNPAFHQLTGYSPRELQGMRLSRLHPRQEETILSKLDKSSANSQYSEQQQLSLQRKNGDEIPVTLRLVRFGNHQTKFIFAIYQPVPQPKPSRAPMSQPVLKLERLKDQALAMHEIHKLATTDQEFDELIKSILLTIKNVVVCDFAQISLLREKQDVVDNHTVVSTRCREYDQRDHWTPLDTDDQYWYNLSSQDLRQELGTNSFEEIERKLRSRISAILMSRTGHIGTLLIGSLESDFYQQQQTEFVQQVALQIAVLVENINLNAEINRRKSDMALGSRLQQLIGDNFKIDHVLSCIAKLSASEMKSQLATVRLFGKDHTRDSIKFSHDHCDASIIKKFEKEQVIPKILQSREFYVSEIISDRSFKKKAALPAGHCQYQSYACCRLSRNGRAIGILTFYWDKPDQFHPVNQRLGRMLAQKAATAIQTAGIYQEQLSRCETLEQQKEELENFIRHITYELKSPVASIQGHSALLINNLEKEIDHQSLEQLKKINQSAAQTWQYIDDLFQLAHIGSAAYSFANTDLVELIRKAQQELKHQLEQKMIKVVIAKGVANACCDPKLCQQLWINLLKNAIAHISVNDKHPRIVIGRQNNTDEPTFFVRDNGTRLIKKFNGNFFSPSRPGEDEATRNDDTGFELAMAKKIVEIHQGQIWFESDGGTGNTIYFSLPAHNAAGSG